MHAGVSRRSPQERGGRKSIASLQLEARLEFELRSALRSIKFRWRRRGGIGRRAGLKIQWPQGRVGSSPSAGNRLDLSLARANNQALHEHSSHTRKSNQLPRAMDSPFILV